MPHISHVAVQTPAHSAVGELLSYTCDEVLPPGTLVRVPLGRRELLGVVWDTPAAPADIPPGVELRSIACVLPGIAPLSRGWRRLVGFAAHYYQRSVGEIAVTALPPQLRDMTAEQLTRRLAPPKPAKTKRSKSKKAQAEENFEDAAAAIAVAAPPPTTPLVALSEEQASVFAQIEQNPGPFLLYGSTGSGKTEVYL
ncbi:MAG: primosomal protein N', partial [Comamonas sp.]